jgi:allantoicase
MLMMMLQDFPIVPNFWRSFHPIIHKFVIIFPLADLQFYGVSWSTVNGIHTHVYTHILLYIYKDTYILRIHIYIQYITWYT